MTSLASFSISTPPTGSKSYPRFSASNRNHQQKRLHGCLLILTWSAKIDPRASNASPSYYKEGAAVNRDD